MQMGWGKCLVDFFPQDSPGLLESEIPAQNNDKTGFFVTATFATNVEPH